MTNSLMFSHGVAYKPTPVDWAYLAGFFDGEGCVTVSYRGRPKPIGKRKDLVANYPYWAVRIVVTNTSFELLRRIRAKFGGYVHKHGWKPKPNDNWRRQNQWVVSNGPHCLWILSGMLPHLFYKKPEAILAMKFFRRLGARPSKKLSKGEVYARFRILRAIKNLRGRRRRSGSVAAWRLSEYSQWSLSRA